MSIGYCRLLWLFLLLSASLQAQTDRMQVVSSPSGLVQFRFILDEATPYYEVIFNDETLIERSSLGFAFANAPVLQTGLMLTGMEYETHDEPWVPVWGTDSLIENRYTSALFMLTETASPQRRLNIEVRVYDDGAAFRYLFPDEMSDSLLITSELTTFRFAGNDSAWWIPSDEFAYESLYRHTPLSKMHDANTPMTITDKHYCLSIHEAALLDYSEMFLKRDPGDSLLFNVSLWPWPDGICVRAKAPFRTPWRSIMITRTPGQLIESHLTQNLNEPCTIADVSWIKPMKFIGIWWGMHIGKYTWHAGPNHGSTTKRTKQYIDFAAEHGIGGVLVEGWNLGWETWASDSVPKQDFCKAYPDFNLKKVVKYAKSKNVAFISHHETGGNIPEYERQLDSAMALCNRLGITSLKTGYAGPIRPTGMHHHGQYMVRHFQKVVETAAFYHITLNAHESIKPTGLDRTWPNLMTQEVVRGNEWNATYRATPPSHSTILPFTRMLAGPFDNTPGILHVNYQPENNKRLYCTSTHQAAMYVVYYSPMMMMADLPENYEKSWMTSFITAIPDRWDETKVLAIDPGNYICVARRHGEKWFVGALADENCYLLKIPMSLLADSGVFRANMIFDYESTNWKNKPEAAAFAFNNLLTTHDSLYIPLSKAGGFFSKIEPYTYQFCEPYNPEIKNFNAQAAKSMEIFKKQETYGQTNVSHLAVGAQVSLKNNYSQKYPASGTNALCDGTIGSFNYSDGGWQGFEGDDLEAVVELPESKSIQSISLGFLFSPNDWIFLPKRVAIYVSSDGIHFLPVQDTMLTNSKPRDMKVVDIQHIAVNFDPVEVKYIKIVAENQHVCPEWHYAKGNKAWIFCDEIVVQ